MRLYLGVENIVDHTFGDGIGNASMLLNWHLYASKSLEQLVLL